MLLVQARIAAAELQHDEAVKFLQQAVQAEDKLYNEPKDWFFRCAICSARSCCS